MRGDAPLSPPRTTAIGALGYYVSHADSRYYQPSNITFGILPPVDGAPRQKQARQLAASERALRDLDAWKADAGASHAERSDPGASRSCSAVG